MPVDGFISLAFGVSGVVTLVQQAFSIYRYLDEARYFGENVYQHYVMFQHQVFRFQSWYNELQALNQAQERGLALQSQTPTFAPMSLLPASSVTAPPDPNQWLRNAVSQIVSILESVSNLCDKYKVEEAFHSDSKPIKHKHFTLQQGIVPSTIGAAVSNDGKLAFATQEKIIREGIIQEKTAFLGRTKYGTTLWREADKDKFEDLVSQFKYWNEALELTLPSPTKLLVDLISSVQLLSGEVNSANLRLIGNATSGIYDNLSRRAALKSKIHEQAQLTPTARVISTEDIHGMPVGLPKVRILASLDRKSQNKDLQPILIELKNTQNIITEAQWTEARSNVEALVRMLELASKPPTLSTLHCIGYFESKRVENRYGLVMEVPPTADPLRAPMSLFELMEQKRTLPTLAERIRIAQRLAISLLELQNADWLHKDISSKNILFFFNRSNSLIDFDNPYLAGFDFARANANIGISVERESLEFDYYWHPALRANALQAQNKDKPRAQYHAGFDVYSLGLVLLGIALWRSVSTFHSNAVRDPEKYTRLLISLAQKEIAHRVGETYREAVLKCITGYGLQQSQDDAVTVADPTDNPSVKSSLRSGFYCDPERFYWGVVRELERCHCGHAT
jgi:hypothetical protein